MFLGLQAFTNFAVALGMLPTKGLVLPFISYGGSSLLVNCGATGVLLNISRPRSGSRAENTNEPKAQKDVVPRRKRKRARQKREAAS